MRAIGMGLFAHVILLCACVGGPGPLPSGTENGVPIDDGSQITQGSSSVQQGGDNNGTGNRDDAEEPAPARSSTAAAGCTFDQCEELTCTCGRFTTKVRKCVATGCAKTCAEAGCT